MTDPRTQAIERAFAAAARYDQYAAVQRVVATNLAASIAALSLPANPRICEIGCGTGFLSAALAARIAGGDWLLTDIAQQMVERCRDRLGPDSRFRFSTGDSEAPEALAGEPPFDLICSSLTLQWFDDLSTGIARLFARLAPGGWLVFTTLAAGTFAEWREAHDQLGLRAGTPAYPSLAALASIRPEGIVPEVSVERFAPANADARSFLRALKAIGAGTPAPGHAPLPSPVLRRVMREFERNGAVATYEVATWSAQRPL